jgi:hypothetical protein
VLGQQVLSQICSLIVLSNAPKIHNGTGQIYLAHRTGRVYAAHRTGQIYLAHRMGLIHRAHICMTHGRDKSGPYGGRRKRGPYRFDIIVEYVMVFRWQMATAAASAASSGRGTALNLSRIRTISPT